jgi:hypothetical protein
MGYALFMIILWFVLNRPDEIVCSITNAIELVLAVLAFYEGARVLHVRKLLSIDSQ